MMKVLIKTDLNDYIEELLRTGQAIEDQLFEQTFRALSIIEIEAKNNIRVRSGLNVISGTLLNSIEKEVRRTSDGVEGLVGPNERVPYAPIHEHGGTVEERFISPRNRLALRFVTSGGQEVFSKGHTIPSFEIPARPYMAPAAERAAPIIEAKFGAFVDVIFNKGK